MTSDSPLIRVQENRGRLTAWWDDYYRPLQDNVIRFRKRYPDVAEARALADQCQREIDVWRAYSEFYGYHFFVLRAR